MVKVIIVGTNASDLKGHATGVWLEELATPYYKFRTAGYQLVIASPNGGEIPVDQASMKGDAYTPICKQFIEDEKAQSKITNSIKIADIEWSDVDAIFLSGGHGTCVDFVDNKDLKKAIEKLAAANKVIAAVCHGNIALVQCVGADKEPLLKGKTVTCFTDSEEEAANLKDKCPFLLETKFKELGANVDAAANFTSKVCVDGKLVTGQNPQSSEECAAAVCKILGK